MQYTKGTFQIYRAVAKVHLGSIQSNLMEGEEVEFDGFTMKRGGEDHALHALRGAIKVGWLVPQDAAPTKYVPQPAGIVVHKADGITTDEINVGFDVDRDDVNVGSLQEIRPKNAPATHKASNAGQKSGVRSGGGLNEADGKVVARFKTSAKQEAVQIGKNDRKVVQSLDNKSSVDVERVTIARAVATGDVQEAIGGESLEDLLPEAASTGTPDPGVVLDGQRVEAAPDLSLIQQFIPGFDWDLSVQWRRRAKIAVDQYSKIPAVLNYIMSVETDAVKSAIGKQMGNR